MQPRPGSGESAGAPDSVSLRPELGGHFTSFGHGRGLSERIHDDGAFEFRYLAWAGRWHGSCEAGWGQSDWRNGL